MCYSAQIWQNYQQYVRHYGATLSLDEFIDLFWRRRQGEKIKVAKAMEDAFAAGPWPMAANADAARGPVSAASATSADRYSTSARAGAGLGATADLFDSAEPAGPQAADEAEDIVSSIHGFRAEQAQRLQAELFRQRKRLADAERSLATKPTKAASEHQRIANTKIAWCREKLADLQRTTLTIEDERIFPGMTALVMTSHGGQRVIRPMRYGCRPAGKPASHDRRFPGTYNARRDSLEGYWKGQFGLTHGIVVLQSFYENVARHRTEQRELAQGESESNLVLQFAPTPPQDLLIACLWSHWTPPPRGPEAQEPALLSFAVITDDPPPEIALAGHDRCPIAIRPEHLDAWLDPASRSREELQAILGDRAPMSFAWRMAA